MAKGLQGPVAGEDNVMGGTKVLAREVGVPGGVSSREEALNGSRTRSALVGRVAGRVVGSRGEGGAGDKSRHM
jgi:hypothetical protein